MSNRENRPTAGGLSFLLRHRELWPKDFFWYYPTCSTCALGLAHRAWPNHIEAPDGNMVSRALGISKEDGAAIFGSTGTAFGVANANVTPEQVADQLDAVGLFRS